MFGLPIVTLRRDHDSQAVLYNGLLRLHCIGGQWGSAEALLANAAFPEERAPTAQLARFHYYVALVRAFGGRHSDAMDSLMQCLRKGPHHLLMLSPTSEAEDSSGGAVGVGFVQAVHKLLVVVQMLSGEIPERKLFDQRLVKASLAPYRPIVRAVRDGNLPAYYAALSPQQQPQLYAKLERDGLLPLLKRLEEIVLKSGISRLTSVYVRISIPELVNRLLQSPTAESPALQVCDSLLSSIRNSDASSALLPANARVCPQDDTVVCVPSLENVFSLAATTEALALRIFQAELLQREAQRGMRYPVPDLVAPALNPARRHRRKPSEEGDDDGSTTTNNNNNEDDNGEEGRRLKSLLDDAAEIIPEDYEDDGDIAMDEDFGF